MSVKTLTRADLVEKVYEEVGLSRNETSSLVEQVLDQMIDALSRGENVKLSSFGSFNLRKKSERIGRNPKTGEEVMIAPRTVITFKASDTLKKRVNGEA